jgi:hypothetical protein
MSTTICCLLYGNYTKLADRCLRPISELYNNGVEVRLGCNETSQETDELISQLFPASDRLIIRRHNPQIYKYPVMRELFNARPITTDKVMWFDDDSYIKDTNPIGWLNSTQEFMNNNKADMIGSLYYMPVLHKQQQWRRLHCSWFKPELHRSKACFATGGWWTLKSEVITKYDWPHPMLKHRGGDVLLGELMHHAGLKLVKYNTGVGINSDSEGKESQSKRRGYDEPPIGA